MAAKYQFLKQRADVFPYVKDIQNSSDNERKALGFLVPAAYETAIYQEKIILALTRDESPEYAGHIMFGGIYPRARVFQTVVTPKHRGEGLSSLLMREFLTSLISQSYTSVSAKVASDLKTANKFYEKHGFESIRVLEGGKAKKRKIILREKLLDTPSLFNWTRTIEIVEGFSFSSHSYDSSPQYLIDLNVVFDVVHKRANKEVAGMLMQASFQNLIRVSVSEELISELERNTGGRKDNDPLLEMMKNFWRIPRPPTGVIQEIEDDLGPIIFPKRHGDSKLTPQDKSDIAHLATAIHHKVVGFITSENAILAAGQYLRTKYGIDVLSPHDIRQLVDEIPEAMSENFNSQSLSIEEIVVSECFTEMRKQNLSDEAMPPSEAVKKEQVRALRGTNQNGEVIAIAWWTVLTGPTPLNRAYIFVKGIAENQNLIFDSISEKISRQCSFRDVSLVELVVDTNLAHVSRHLIRNGFSPTGATYRYGEAFKKVCVGDALHDENWSRIKLKIAKVSGAILLTGETPKITPKSLIDVTNVDGENQQISLSNLERLLHPTLIVDENTPSVISPIRRFYADALFGIKKPQLSLLESSEAVLSRRRVYFCKPAAKKCFEKGGVVFFYESGKGDGKSAIIAAARIVECSIAKVSDMDESLLRLGVIDRNMLSKVTSDGNQAVVFFENVIHFKKPVGYDYLKSIGCDNGSNFITSQNISSGKTMKILQAGL